jgi:hypothetical protein
MNSFVHIDYPVLHPGVDRMERLVTVARSWAGAVSSYMQEIARRRADEKLWSLAQQDPRLMAELESARCRQEG